jgi:hypothetical protein
MDHSKTTHTKLVVKKSVLKSQSTLNHFSWNDCSWSWKWDIFSIFQWILAKLSQFQNWLMVGTFITIWLEVGIMYQYASFGIG